MGIRGLSKKCVDSSVFVFFKWVYMYIFHTDLFVIKFQKKTRVVLKVFSKIKIKFYSIKGSMQVQTSHSKNCPNCVEEFLVVNIYSLKKKTCQNIIIFNCDVVSIVLVIVILILIWHKRFFDGVYNCTLWPNGDCG